MKKLTLPHSGLALVSALVLSACSSSNSTSTTVDVTADTHSGGIEVIDPDTYEHSILLDDGTDDDNQGYFVDAQVVDASLGYLLTYESFGVTTLRTFNPTTGLLSETLFEGLQDADITVLEQGPDNHLWVGLQREANGFVRIDLDTGLLVDEIVATELVPSGVEFINVSDGGSTTSMAFAATRAADYGSYRTDRISLTEGNIVNGSYPATASDTVITTYGSDLYQIGRFGTDTITRFDPIDTSAFDYQYSVNKDGEEGSANPQAIAFLNDTKAYLTRYGSNSMWIINPSATNEQDFFVGEIDFSAYDDDVPNMTDAMILGDRLFVLLERLEGFNPTKVAYLAVIDTNTDTEILTNQGSDGLAGIELNVVNPTALQYNSETGEIYVVGRGKYF